MTNEQTLAKQLIAALLHALPEDVTKLNKHLAEAKRLTLKQKHAAMPTKPLNRSYNKPHAVCNIGIVDRDAMRELIASVPTCIYNPFTVNPEHALQWGASLHSAALIALLAYQGSTCILPPEKLTTNIEYTPFDKIPNEWPTYKDVMTLIDLSSVHGTYIAPPTEAALVDLVTRSKDKSGHSFKQSSRSTRLVSAEYIKEQWTNELPIGLPCPADSPALLKRLNVPGLLIPLFTNTYPDFAALLLAFPSIVLPLMELLTEWSSMDQAERPRVSPHPKHWCNKAFHGQAFLNFTVTEHPRSPNTVALHRVVLATSIMRTDLWQGWSGSGDPRYYAESAGRATRGVPQACFMWGARHAARVSRYDINPFVFKQVASDGLKDYLPHKGAEHGEDALLQTPVFDTDDQVFIKS